MVDFFSFSRHDVFVVHSGHLVKGLRRHQVLSSAVGLQLALRVASVRAESTPGKERRIRPKHINKKKENVAPKAKYVVHYYH